MTTDVVVYGLHAGQEAVLQSTARYKVVACGRRWGKTLLGVLQCLATARSGGRTWWIGPTYAQALEGWRYLLQVGDGQVERSTYTMRWGKGSVQIKTADNEDHLRGAGLDGVVMDEAAVARREVWEHVLRPALADRQGWALFPSTPQHFNWFFELFEHASADTSGEWACWQEPTWRNPYIDPGEIEAARRDMTPEDFDQEFAASFTAVGGAVFPELSRDRPFFLRPRPAGVEFRRAGAGMDWGTTRQHQAAVVSGGLMATGAVWYLSSWLSDSGSDNLWLAEVAKRKRDFGLSFARYDRSQSSIHDRLAALGLDADKGSANVEARIGVLKGLIQRRSVFWDSSEPGNVDLYNHLCAYHRDDEGKIVEEEDDDVDASLYLVSELAQGGGGVIASGYQSYGKPRKMRAGI